MNLISLTIKAIFILILTLQTGYYAAATGNSAQNHNKELIPIVQSVPIGSAVQAITYSRDGQLLAVSYGDNTVRIFKIVDDKFYLLRVLTGHNAPVTSLAFDSQGQFLTSHSYSYNNDHTIKKWNLKTGQLLSTTQEHKKNDDDSTSVDDKPIIAIDNQGRYRASTTKYGVDYGVINLQEISTGKVLKRLDTLDTYDRNCAESAISRCDYGIHFLTFNPQGNRLISAGGEEQEVKLWEIPSGKLLSTVSGQEEIIGDIAFDGQGKQLAMGIDYQSGLANKTTSTLKIWELLSGKILILPQTRFLSPIAFDNQGKYLAVGEGDGYGVKVWEVPTRKLLFEFSGGSAGSSIVAFDPKGEYLVTSVNKDYKNTGIQLTMWKIPTEKQRLASTTLDEEYPHDQDWMDGIVFPKTPSSTDYDENYAFATFDPQGRYLTAIKRNRSIEIWEISNRKLVKTLPTENISGSHNLVAFDKEGKLMVSTTGNTINLWEVGSWKLLKTLKGHERQVTSIAIDSQGKYIAGSSDDINQGDGNVKIWDVNNDSPLATAQYRGKVTSIAFTHNGQYLVVAGTEGYLAFYEITTGQFVLSLHSLDNGGKLILLADGRFDADEKGMDYLRYTEQGTFNSYPAKEFKSRFFKPKSVKQTLQNVSNK